MSSPIECPICMDVIDMEKNSVVTDCGHTFHCSCLMQNAAHNGFGCPYCRSKMAEEPANEEEEEDEEESTFSQVGPVLTDNALTSFRMFQQQIEGAEPEEEPEDEDDWETDEDEDEETEAEMPAVPDAEYMAVNLRERGITYEDLVKHILIQEHSSWGQYYQHYDRRSSEIFGQFRAISSRYDRQRDVPAIAPPVPQAEVPHPVVILEIDPRIRYPIGRYIRGIESVSIPAGTYQDSGIQDMRYGRLVSSYSAVPEVAEIKTLTIPRRRECMFHV